MPGTITVDAARTFATMLAMSASQKVKFGTTEPDISAKGEKKWTVSCAVTYLAEPGMRPVSEVIDVTVTGPDNLNGIHAGLPVEFTDLRCGVSAAEKTERGGVRGGRLYWMASNVRPARAPADHKAA